MQCHMMQARCMHEMGPADEQKQCEMIVWHVMPCDTSKVCVHLQMHARGLCTVNRACKAHMQACGVGYMREMHAYPVWRFGAL